MAVSDISLSSGIRISLYNIQTNSLLIQRTEQRLSSGKYVNSALDNPTNYFAAANNVNRAADILSRKDGILEGVQTIRAADNGATAISSLLDTMKGLASAAMASSSQEDRNVYAATYTEIQKQITSLAKDGGYRGTNLLNGDNLIMEFGEHIGDSTLMVTGFDATADGLGVGYMVLAGTGAMVPHQTTNFSGIKAHQANVEFTDSFNIGAVSQSTIDDSALQVLYYTNGTGVDTSLSFTSAPVMQNGLLTVTGTVSQNLPPPPVPLPLPRIGNVPTYTQISWGGNLERSFSSFTSPANISKVFVDRVEQSGNYTVDNSGTVVFNSSVPLPGQVVKVEKFSASVTWDSNAAMTASLNQVDSALDTLRNISTSLSSNLNIATARLDFSSGMSNLLTEGANTLTQADMNQESATMLMLHTRQNLGITSLGLSSRTQQSILKLF